MHVKMLTVPSLTGSKPFLKRGEGLARFGKITYPSGKKYAMTEEQVKTSDVHRNGLEGPTESALTNHSEDSLMLAKLENEFQNQHSLVETRRFEDVERLLEHNGSLGSDSPVMHRPAGNRLSLIDLSISPSFADRGNSNQWKEHDAGSSVENARVGSGTDLSDVQLRRTMRPIGRNVSDSYDIGNTPELLMLKYRFPGYQLPSLLTPNWDKDAAKLRDEVVRDMERGAGPNVTGHDATLSISRGSTPRVREVDDDLDEAVDTAGPRTGGSGSMDRPDLSVHAGVNGNSTLEVGSVYSQPSSVWHRVLSQRNAKGAYTDNSAAFGVSVPDTVTASKSVVLPPAIESPEPLPYAQRSTGERLSLRPEAGSPPIVTQVDRSRLYSVSQLDELEELVARLKEDQAYIEKLKARYEELVEIMERERSSLAQERQEFEGYKDRELGRLKADRLRVDKTESAAQKTLLRESEEKKVLQRQLVDLNHDVCEREARWAEERAKRRTEANKSKNEADALRKDRDRIKYRLDTSEKQISKLEEENQQLRLRLRNRSLPNLLDSSVFSSTMPRTQKASKQVRFNLPGEPSEHVRPKSASPVHQRMMERATQASPPSETRTWRSGIEYRSSQEAIAVDPFARQRSAEISVVPSSALPSRVARKLDDGSCEIIHDNQTVERVSADGAVRTYWYHNGDVCRVNADGTEVYTYGDSGTTVVTERDGTKTTRFPNGRQQTVKPDGTREATLEDGRVIRMLPGGDEWTESPDGTRLHVKADGTQVLYAPDGSVETRTADYKQRRFADGSVKTLFADGREETRYSSGRLRIKDSDGNVVRDEMDAQQG